MIMPAKPVKQSLSRTGIVCPACRLCSRSEVLHTERDENRIIRYRRCVGCGARFKTVEEK